MTSAFTKTQIIQIYRIKHTETNSFNTFSQDLLPETQILEKEKCSQNSKPPPCINPKPLPISHSRTWPGLRTRRIERDSCLFSMYQGKNRRAVPKVVVPLPSRTI